MALGLSSPATGNHWAFAAPSAMSVTSSPKQISALPGITSATTCCTFTSMEALPSPHSFTSVTL